MGQDVKREQEDGKILTWDYSRKKKISAAFKLIFFLPFFYEAGLHCEDSCIH